MSEMIWDVRYNDKWYNIFQLCNRTLLNDLAGAIIASDDFQPIKRTDKWLQKYHSWQQGRLPDERTVRSECDLSALMATFSLPEIKVYMYFFFLDEGVLTPPSSTHLFRQFVFPVLESPKFVSRFIQDTDGIWQSMYRLSHSADPVTHDGTYGPN